MEIVYNVLGNCPTGIYVHNDIIEKDACPNEIEYACSIEEPSFIDSFASFDYEGYKIKGGMTKIVIIPRDYDFVIKIPITGIYEYVGEPEDLNLVKVGNCNINYLEEENRIYNSVCDEAKQYLAENKFIGDYCGIPIYIQNKVAKIFDDVPVKYTSSITDKEEVSYLKNIFTDLDVIFINEILEQKGFVKTIAIFKDFKKYLDDVHDENYGYGFRGEPIIFDYGGFDITSYAKSRLGD